MAIAQDILWFKANFGAQILVATQGTPFTIDLISAIGFQETGEIWGPLSRKNMPVANILKLCTGDTLDDTAGRSAFPKNRAALEAHPRGSEMFAVGRKALVDMSANINGYAATVKNPNKFCHGYGIFQYDLQFFKEVDPQYFLNRDYEIFEKSLGKCLSELEVKRKKIGLGGKTTLTDLEMVAVAIAYNTGGYVASRGLKQGHANKLPNGQKKFYGEYILEYLKIAKTVMFSPPFVTESTVVPPPTPVTATGNSYRVETLSEPLNLRSSPRVSAPGIASNIIAKLPRHTVVKAVSDTPVNGFMHVEISIQGGLKRGYASGGLLTLITNPVSVIVSVPSTIPAPVSEPGAAVAARGRILPAVHLKRKPGAVTRRTDMPNAGGAYPLSESVMPTRTATTPDARCAEITEIVDWLDNENALHLRYKPAGPTYCNLYAHDFCKLSGAYLPRVWWSSKAIQRLLAGEIVEPAYLATVDEMRANDLFLWLRDYGLDYGWRQTGTLTKLQEVANAGGLALICARNKIQGRSGHIVAVVPENDRFSAKRNAAGDVVSPLQSQAGRRNFRYGMLAAGWWRGTDFADHGFWVHE